jgi:hypothetical protein
MLGCGLCFLLLEKVVVSILTEVTSSGVSFSSRANSSGRGKDSLRGPLYPFPHLVGGEGSMLSGVSCRASPIANSPKALGMPSYKFSPMHIT